MAVDPGLPRPNEQTTNRVLAALPPLDFDRISRSLQTVRLTRRQVIQHQNEPIEDVYFLDEGACSLVRVLADGSEPEVAMAGPENVIGANVFFGQGVSDCNVVVQIGNPLTRVLHVKAFNEEMERRGAFYNHVIRSNQALTSEIIQTAACNGGHAVEQRCCRWLLTAHDHAGANQFPMTHGILASLLGVRRPTITLTLMDLQRAGLVDQRRGVMTIVDRDGLCERVCDCYTAIKNDTMRLLPELGDDLRRVC